MTHTLELQNFKRGVDGTISGTIRTSAGNTVSLANALRVFPFIRRAHENSRAIVCRQSVGSYVIESIEANGDIKAGCHRIAWSEIERIAKECGAFDDMTLPVRESHSAMSVSIPFDGFGYGSLLDSELDHVAEREAEWWSEREREENTPEHLLIDSRDYAEILNDNTDNSAAREDITREWFNAFQSVAHNALSFDLGLTFDSPDRGSDYLHCTMARCAVRKLFRMSRDHDAHKTFMAHCGRRSIECDWYELDATDIGDLILACLEIEGESDVRYSVFENLSDGDFFYTVWSEQCVDWKKLDAEIAERRAEMQREWEEELSEDEKHRLNLNPYALPILPRCEFTRDMFAANNATN